MREIIGAAFVSLDGVMQAPGGPSEDPTGGFDHGGWVASVADEVFGEELDKLFGRDYDLLLGRRTYDIFSAYWPYAPDEMAGIRDPFNACTKFVVTRSDPALEWENSVALPDIDAVRAIKAADGPDLVIQGSSTLYPQLIDADLLDTLILFTFPVILGRGKRLLGDGTPARTFETLDVRHGPNVVVTTYRCKGPLQTKAIAEQSTSERERARQEAMANGRW